VVLGVGLILCALFLSPLMTLFLGSLGGLILMIARAMNRDARRISDAAQRAAAMQLVLLHEDLSLLRTVRIYGMENVEKPRFDEHLERFRAADVRRIQTEGRLNPTTGLLYGVALVLAIGFLGSIVMVTHRLAPASALVLFAALVGLAHPIVERLRMVKAVRRANRSAGAVFEFLDRKPELQEPGGAQFLPPLRDRISFENVTLESHSGRTLLDNVSVEMPAGSRTAIMSLDEDAKHTMVCLIPRLIDPKVGRVRIDGQDLQDITLESIRAQVATVLQTDLVFTDSVLVNIGLGDPSHGLPRIIEAAKVAHAHNFIQDLPHGYDTIIGPMGHYLEPDAQYRIALARAYLHDPSIVIIEEPAVPLDEDTKHLIDDTVARLSRNRTVIILPHRLSTIRSCDQIVILHNGRVEAIGKPRQLQSESKLFRHLQYVEFNQFATGEIEAGQMNA
jgi:ATP-binding cassette, subfamily B, bacterial